MRITIERSDATLRFAAAIPARLIWRGACWDVVDRPTPIGLDEDAACSPFVTHPPDSWSGWRFTARVAENGETYVFDVRATAAGDFEVVYVYD
jgi:hypothetical protein